MSDLYYFCKYLIRSMDLYEEVGYGLYIVREKVPTQVDMYKLGFVEIEENLRLRFNNLGDYRYKNSISFDNVIIDEGAQVKCLCLRDGTIYNNDENSMLDSRLVARFLTPTHKYFDCNGHIMVITDLWVYRPPELLEDRNKLRARIEDICK